MNVFTILAIAVIGIGAAVYIVKEPLKPRITQADLDMWRTQIQEQKKQLDFLKAWTNCTQAFGELVVDSKGNYACALKRSRWGNIG